MMSGLRAAFAGALLLGACNTLGDYVWARFALRHRAVTGLLHGALLLLVLGAYLGVVRRQPLRGAAFGALVGLAAAASFYALAPLFGYSAMFVSWMALWVGFAFVDGRFLRRDAPLREVLTRGGLAAVASALAFYAISGVWTRYDPATISYLYNFVCWSFAFLPGFLALLAGRPRGEA
jgi:hypothetical protein